MSDLRQGTIATIAGGPFVDDTDGKTIEAALVIQKADVKLKKNGGVYAAASADQGAADAGAPYDDNGDYNIDLDTDDTDTLGRLRVSILKAGALIVWRDFQVIPANVYDSRYGADKLQVDTVEVGGTVVANPDALKFDPSVAIMEDGQTYRTLWRRGYSAVASLVSGFPGGPGKFRNVADTKDRITAEIDPNGNRTNITFDDT